MMDRVYSQEQFSQNRQVNKSPSLWDPDFNPVSMNSEDQNDFWKSVYERAQSEYISRLKTCLDHQTPNYSEVVRDVLEKSTISTLALDQFVHLLLGCGCCKRHAHGILPLGKVHVERFKLGPIETITPEGKKCDCRCRQFARYILRSQNN